MRRLLPVAIALLLLAVACGDDSGSTQDTDEAFDPASTTTEGGPPPRPTDGPAPDIDDLPDGTVVFSPDDVETNVVGEPTTWTPTGDDVEAVDGLLADYVDEHPDLGLSDFDDYVRQYVGTGEVGEIASVNALCDADQFDWEDGLVAVEDGGSCFWHAEVSFRTAQVEDFSVNGVG